MALKIDPALVQMFAKNVRLADLEVRNKPE